MPYQDFRIALLSAASNRDIGGSAWRIWAVMIATFEFGVLKNLTQREIGAIVGMTQANVSREILRLIEAGLLVQGSVIKDDKRRASYYLPFAIRTQASKMR